MRSVDGIAKRTATDIFSELPEIEIKLKPSLSKARRYIKIFAAFFIISLGLATTTIADDIYQLGRIGNLMQNGRFLVLFQNNAELRPTGGFLGSFAIITTKNKKIEQYRVEGNIYKADNEFIKTHSIPAPKPFQKIWPGSLMALNSSNWSPDFSTSADQVKWYYEKEYGDASIDGVIAVNSSAAAKLMPLVGTINLPDYDVTFTAENFITTLQRYVEKDYYDNLENQDRNEPKEILNDLGKEFLARLARANPLSVSSTINRLVNTHEIQFYFNDFKKQSIVEKSNWSVEISKWDGNYLYVNNANLGGGKGSLNVDQSIAYEGKINHDSTQEALVTISRINHGRSDYPVSDNLNYTRIYVPLGSKLNYAFIDGADIMSELSIETDLDKTVFGFWFDTAVLQTRQAKLSYTIPPSSSKKLLFEHQPGTVAETVDIILNDQKIFTGELIKQKILDIL